MSEPHFICAFNDCAIPRDCECVKRGYPNINPDKVNCLVPAINAEADRLGWQRPYPDVLGRADDGP